MKLLLDTHVLLWALSSPDRIPEPVRARVEHAANAVFVSVVSLWEIELKAALGKLRVPAELGEHLVARRFTELALQARHVSGLRGLPQVHRDPFDRMLVAQAKVDGLIVVTADAKFRGYPVKLLEV